MPRRPLRSWLDPFPALQALRAFAAKAARRAVAPVARLSVGLARALAAATRGAVQKWRAARAEARAATQRALEQAALRAKPELTPMDWRNPPSESVLSAAVPLVATAAALTAASYLVAELGARDRALADEVGANAERARAFDDTARAVGPVGLDAAPGPRAAAAGDAEAAGADLEAVSAQVELLDPGADDPADDSGTGSAAGDGLGGLPGPFGPDAPEGGAGGSGSSSGASDSGSGDSGGSGGLGGLGGDSGGSFLTGGSGTGSTGGTNGAGGTDGSGGASDPGAAGGTGGAGTEGGAGALGGASGDGASGPSGVTPPTRFDTGAAPTRFVSNAGQWTDGTDFAASGPGYRVALSAGGFVTDLSREPTEEERRQGASVTDRVTVRFAGIDPRARAEGTGRLESVSHFYSGSDPEGWRENVAEYAGVTYAGAYPGADLFYRAADGGRVEFAFSLQPGAVASAIGFTVEGATARVDEDGRLVLTTPAGAELVQTAPVAFHEGASGAVGDRTPVGVSYAVRADGSIGFAVQGADPERALVIDPVLTYSTTVGSAVYGLTADAAGNAYATGTDGVDAKVWKVGPTGSVVWTATLGGGRNEEGHAVALGPNGTVSATGWTQSIDFPTTGGAYQTDPGDGRNRTDAFVVRLTAAGALDWASYLGGSGEDYGYGIAVDQTSGDAVVVGTTGELNFGSEFPTYLAAQGTRGGGDDGFVTRFNAAGTGVTFSTFRGGAGTDAASAVALDSTGTAVAVGTEGGAGFVYRYTTGGNVTASAGTGAALSGVAVDNLDRVYVTGSGFTARYASVGASADYTIAAGGAAIAVDGTHEPVVVGTTTGITTTRYEADGSGTLWTDTQYTYYGTGYAAALGGGLVFAGGSTVFGSGVVLAYGPPVAPTITAIADDTGSSNSDRLTSDTTLSANGTAPASSTVTVFQKRADQAVPTQLGTTTADGSGLWTYALATLTQDATYYLTATATSSGETSAVSAPFTFVLDTTPPAVTLAFPEVERVGGVLATTDTRPLVTVRAADANGFPGPVTVTLDVDFNGDGDFLDSGELGAATATGTDFATAATAAFGTYASLTPGTSPAFRARVTDRAGNAGSSAVVTLTVDTSPTDWVVVPIPPVDRSPYGPTVDPLTAMLAAGDVSATHALDLDLSPPWCATCTDALVYHSQEADPAPTVQAVVRSDSARAVPTSVVGTLMWDGAVAATKTWSGANLAALSAGGAWVFGLAPATPGGTGAHTYSLDLFFDFDTGTDVNRSASGRTYLVDRSGSAYGAGWAFANTDALVTIAADGFGPAGLLRIKGTGGWTFYSDAGSGAYAAPSDDRGTLAYDSGTGGWTYTDERGAVRAFDALGRQVRWVGPDGARAVTYTYDGSGTGTAARLATVEAPDGGVGTFTYASGLLADIEAAAGTVTLTHDGTDLVEIEDPDGTVRSLTYDGSHRLLTNKRDGTGVVYTYDAFGLVDTYVLGVDPDIGPGSGSGLGAAGRGGTGGSAPSTYTDALGHTWTTWFDANGLPVRTLGPDGAVRTWARTAAGYVTAYTDALDRTTSYTLDSEGRVLTETAPDGAVTTFVYGGAFGSLTQSTDALGGVWTYTTDAQGRTTAATDPLGRTTSYTYGTSGTAAGRLETVTDALGRTVTSVFDTAGRPVQTLAGGAQTGTIGYDAAGNAATYTDPLGHTATTVYDELSRPLTVTDPTGRVTSYAYDAAGRLLSVTAPTGRVTSYGYDAAGQLEVTVDGYGTGSARRTTSVYDAANRFVATIDPLGRRTTLVLDAEGRTVATIDALGNRTTAVYDAEGQVLEARDALGRVTSFEYDLAGRLVTTTDALGHVGTTGYDALGRAVSRTNPLGHTTTWVYDAASQLVAVIDPLGNTSTTVYDAAGQVVARVDPRGNVTSWVYDARGRVEATIDALGNRTTAVYDAADRLVATVDARGNRTTTVYDGAGRVVAQIDALGRAVTSVYDTGGRYSATVDPLGNRTTTLYDALDRVEATVDALGNRTTAVYDALDRVVASIDALGNRTTAVYDELGRVVATIDALGNRTTSTFDAAGNVVAVTDALGKATSYGYDGLNRVVSVTDPLGNVSSVGYDAAGRAVTTTDALGRVSTSAFDAADRLVASVDALNNRTTWGYDEAGNVVTVTDALNRVSTTIYDALNRAFAQVDALGNRTTIAFDEAGNAVSVTDARGNVSTTVYDELNRGYAQVDALGNRTTWTFDEAGNAVTTTDALGRVTTTLYDALNRGYARIDALGNRATSTFDANGNVRTTVDQLGRTTTYTYDARNQVVSTTDARGNVWTTQYDALGRGWRAIDPLGNDTRTYFDAAGRVVETADQLGYRRSTGYDAVGNAVTSTDERGTVTTRTYDALNRVTGVQDALGNRTTAVYDAVGNVVESIDALGNRSTAVYDALNRVSASIDALGNRNTATYDAVGNVVTSTDPRGNVSTAVYDALNRAHVRIDALGNRTTTTFDAVGNAITSTDPLNRTGTAVYDALDRLVASVDPLGNAITTVFDAAGQVSATVDPLGNRTTWTYDAVGNAVTTTDALGDVSTSVYDALNRRTVRIDPLGQRATTVYDARGMVVSVRDQVGTMAVYGYDAAGNAVTQTDALGRVTTTVFDALNRGYARIDALGGRTTVTFDAAGNAVAVTDALGRTTTTVFDALNRGHVRIDALGNRTTAVFDAAGNATVRVDALGNRTTTTFDALNRAVAVTDALNHTTTTTFDAAGQVSASTDALNHTTSYGYDARGLLSTVTDPLGNVGTTGYDAAGNAVARTDPRGNTTTTVFDALNRGYAQVDALGNRTTAVFDAAGRMTASIDQLGHRTTSTYDARGRRTAVTDPLNHTTTTTFDAVGNAIAVTDALGNTTTTTFDALNRPTVSTDPLGFRTTSTFDAVGNRLTLEDASGNTTTWTYDALDRVTAETDPLGNTATTSYDAVGRRASETDRLGRRRDYGYDAAGRRTTEAWYATGGALAQTQTWTYDAANRMLTAQDPDGTYTFGYDTANRVTSVQEPFGLVLTMGYDEAGNRTGVQDSKGGVTTVAFDALNRQTSESVAGTGVSAMRFDTAYTARSQVASVTRYSDVNGTSVVGTTAYQYDAAGRTTALLHTSAAGATLGHYTYAYDAADRLTAKTEGATTTYAYDVADQLTADGATTFGYDATGNRTNAGYATGTGNRLSTDGVWTYTHDANGNLTKRSKGAAAETWVYTYDHRNQMLTATQSATDGGAATQRVTYAYDAFGVRIERQGWDGTTTTTERYGVDGWDPAKPGAVANEAFDVWADLDGTNAVVARYAWGTGFDALAARQTAAGAVQWALADRQGSVRLVTDSASVTQASASYTAFGGPTGTLVGGIGYTGQRHDAITGLISLGEGQRELDTETGRLAQTDPGGFEASGPNLYTYVMNGPTNFTDPSGHQPPTSMSQEKGRSDPPKSNPFAPPMKHNSLGLNEAERVRLNEQMKKSNETGDSLSALRLLLPGGIVGTGTGAGDKLRGGFLDEFHEDQDAARETLRSPGSFLNALNEQINLPSAMAMRLVSGEPEPIVEKLKQLADVLETDTESGLGRVLYIGVKALVLRRLGNVLPIPKGAVGPKPTQKPATLGPKSPFDSSQLRTLTLDPRCDTGLTKIPSTRLPSLLRSGHQEFGNLPLGSGAVDWHLHKTVIAGQRRELNLLLALVRGVKESARDAQWTNDELNLRAGFERQGSHANREIFLRDLRTTIRMNHPELRQFLIGDDIAPNLQPWLLPQPQLVGPVRGPVNITATGADAEPIPPPGDVPAVAAKEDQQNKKQCFAAGTPILTPLGHTTIESLKSGDLILCRDEHDPMGDVFAKHVEEVFVSEAPIWHLHVAGRVIRTTGGHPFFVPGRGWVPCQELRVGDWLLTLDGLCARVEDLLDTGVSETVYNVRVADLHTYFVGCDEWGFSVWAHNACVVVSGWKVKDEFSKEYGAVTHYTIEVVPNQGPSLNTHQDGHVDQTTKKGTPAVIRVFSSAEVGFLNTRGTPWQIEVDDTTATNLMRYIRGRLNVNNGTYDPMYNSCATYVWDVLNLARRYIPDLPKARPYTPSDELNNKDEMYGLAIDLYKYLDRKLDVKKK